MSSLRKCIDKSDILELKWGLAQMAITNDEVIAMLCVVFLFVYTLLLVGMPCLWYHEYMESRHPVVSPRGHHTHLPATIGQWPAGLRQARALQMRERLSIITPKSEK